MLEVLEHLPDELDEPTTPLRRSLLSCPHCHVPCALGFSDHTSCHVCGIPVPIPAGVRADRDERRARSQARREKDRRWQEVLRTHPRFYRSPGFISPLSFLAPFAAAVGGYYLGYRQGEYGQAGFVWLAGIGVVHYLTSLLLESRKQEQVRALLSAHKQEQGPTLCRVCSAPLSFQAEMTDCSCDHCGADNILCGADHSVSPRPDLVDVDAVFRQVYGDELSQRAAHLYPLTIFLGFSVLAVLTFYAVEAPRGHVP